MACWQRPPPSWAATVGVDVHSSPFDLYRAGQSPLHRLDARAKLILALALVLCLSLTPGTAWPTYILLFALILSSTVLSELGPGLVLRRAMLALPFAVAALPLLLTVPGQTLVSVRLGPLVLAISQPGLVRFISIVIRSWLSVQVAILLTATTELPDLLAAMSHLRLPRLLVAVLSLMWRYLAVLVDEALRMMRARESRSGSWTGRGGSTVGWRASVTGSMAGSLFLRGLERSEHIHNAMLSRGYDGSIRSFETGAMDKSSRVLVWLGLLILGGLLLLGHWLA